MQKQPDPVEHHTEELERIPLIRKTAVAVDIMDLAEIEEKIDPYSQLWKLYAEALVKLTRKSKLSQVETARACKVYRAYITDVLQQVDAVMTLFVMEKELRVIKNRGHFPVPKIVPPGHKN